MNKKGFTLIEVIASLSIILIIFSLTFSAKTIHSTISNEIQCKSALYDVENLITFSKAYCKKNKTIGKIQVDNMKNKITLSSEGRKVIKKVYLPKEIKINGCNICMKVNSNGLINKGNTIEFKDDKNNLYKITIAAGIDYITVSKVD